MEIYYAIMNILDYYAKNNKRLDSNMRFVLDFLAEKGDHKIEDIADANDCGNCKTWTDVIKALRELYKSGDRI